jgi:hypothetical protein
MSRQICRFCRGRRRFLKEGHLKEIKVFEIINELLITSYKGSDRRIRSSKFEDTWKMGNLE